MEIAIIKYNAGNIQSVLYALERLGVQANVTDDVEAIQSAGKVIFPGVGEASTAMHYLRQRNLDKVIINLQQPVLGVCLGMQLMCAHSEENNTTCLGIFNEPVSKFSLHTQPELLQPDNTHVAGNTSAKRAEQYKIPQIGWNKIYNVRSPLMQGAEDGYCYFVHSYYAALGEHTIATTDYITPYSAALHRNNFYGVQFHPEKSADTGERILENFIRNII